MNKLKIFLLLFQLLIVSTVFASEKNKVVLHLSNQHKLHNLVNNVTNIRKAYDDEMHIVVVVNGPAVTKFAKFSNSQEQVDALLEMKAEVSVCAIAMSKNEILKENLLDGLIYLEKGGVARIIELQTQGYSYIKI